MGDDDAHEVYDEAAASYADTNPHVEPRAGYEWPMVDRLLPDLDGLRVLDAGTGPGFFAARFADRGAEVVGVDANEAMVAEARERYGDRVVLSTDHPFSTYFVIEHEPPDIGSADAQSADYYAVERYERNWGEEDDPLWVPFYRRPLREVLRPLFDAGFVLEDLLEPPPETDDELLGYFDEETPRFLALRARLA